MKLEGKIALVTGAARRIGRAIAVELAAAGADIALHYGKSVAEADDAAAEIHRLGRRVELFQADLAQPQQIEAMFGRFAKIFRKLDMLVNNAGVYHRTPLDTLSAEQWDGQFAVNARAAALCIRYAIPLMKPQKGVIINIADIAAEKPFAGYPAYCASKAALLALTKSAAKALAIDGIRVNSVAPGAALWSENDDAAQQEKVLSQIPMKRCGNPHDVASAVLFLARSDYITGQNLRVDGGWCMM